MTSKKAKSITKTALVVSLIMLAVWIMLGTGSTIAWFTDVSEVRVNSFVIGEIGIDVSYYDEEEDDYLPVDQSTEIFDDEALYEPGYTQVVLVRFENTGTVPFDYRFCVNINNVILGFTETGAAIYLPDYLRYGVVFADTEDELRLKVADRMTARGSIADTDFGDQWMREENEFKEYEFNRFTEQHYDMQPGDVEFAAVVIYMPEHIGNEANYRGDQEPRIELGISVLASQSGTIQYFDENNNPDYDLVGKEPTE